MTDAKTHAPETSLDELAEDLAAGPVLICDSERMEWLLGIVTAFDLL